MQGYNYNQYDTSSGSGIPDQGTNGLPLVIADANLPTQAVSDSPIRRDTSLNYSPHVVESGYHTPATTEPVKHVQYARVSASGDRVKQKFAPVSQPKQPSLWATVVRAVVGGKIKSGANYAASGDYTTQGGGLGGINGPSSGSGNGGRVSTGGSGGIVTPGGSRTA